ncbi:MAG: ABC transporter ATP-binding protein [Brevinematales bacterium]|nr:ABC transporter ATP-binding protein [Brevinematales bacterium]
MKFLEASGIEVHFPIYKGIFRRVSGEVKAVDGVSFELKKGEVLSIIGESGSGKTTLGNAVLGLYPPTAGSMSFLGGDVRQSWFSGKIQAVFQNPYSSLNPRMNILNSIAEPYLRIEKNIDKEKLRVKVGEALETVGIEASAMFRYPHEFSGGQRQRVSIARALISHPELIILDEPVSSLDVSIRAQILNLLSDLKTKFDLSYIFISHDLATVRFLSQTILIIYRGKVLESGGKLSIFERPANPYTHLLLQSARDIVVQHDPIEREETVDGCPFYSRCPAADGQCKASFPEATLLEENHYVYCYHPYVH